MKKKKTVLGILMTCLGVVSAVTFVAVIVGAIAVSLAPLKAYDPPVSEVDFPAPEINGTPLYDEERELPWEDFELPIPKPPALRFMSIWRGTGTNAFGFDPTKFPEYEAELFEDGWQKVSGPSIKGSILIDYSYAKGNDTLYIGERRGSAIYDELCFLIRFEKGYDGTEREGGVTNKKALSLIKTNLFFRKNSWERGAFPSVAAERDYPELFDKMRIQVFNAYGDDNDFGQFFVGGGKVFRLRFASLTNTCIYDIDGDGEYELISLGFSDVQVYKLGPQPGKISQKPRVYEAYPSSWRSYKDYEGTSLHMVTDGGGAPKIFSVAENKDGVTVLGQDYGRLIIKDGKLMPERMDIFPFQVK